MYGAIRNLFDLPIASPHRALSSEFACLPVQIRYRQITRRIASRYMISNPLQWLDGTLPEAFFQRAIRASLDSAISDSLINYSCPRTPDPAAVDFLSCLDVPGDVVCKDLFRDGMYLFLQMDLIWTENWVIPLLFIRMQIVYFLCLNIVLY